MLSKEGKNGGAIYPQLGRIQQCPLCEVEAAMASTACEQFMAASANNDKHNQLLRGLVHEIREDTEFAQLMTAGTASEKLRTLFNQIDEMGTLAQQAS